MQKEQAEKIAEMIANDIHLTYDPYYSPVFKEKIVNILLTATSVKVPEISDEELERAAKLSNCWTMESQRGFGLGVSWAVERMRNE